MSFVDNQAGGKNTSPSTHSFRRPHRPKVGPKGRREPYVWSRPTRHPHDPIMIDSIGSAHHTHNYWWWFACFTVDNADAARD